MAKYVESNDDFSGERAAIQTRPTNHIPPIAEGMHLYMPHKYKKGSVDPDPEQWIIQDPWGDATTDFKQGIGYGRPTLQAGSAAMGGHQVLVWPTTPALRIVTKQVMAFATKKWSIHAAFTVNGVSGGSGNRCLFSMVDPKLSKYLLFYATSSSAGPARISAGFGSVNPLGTNTIVPVNYDLTYPLVANQKEILSFCYNGTLMGGQMDIFRGGQPLQTITNMGDFTLEGEGYLGTDVRSSTNSSDFKGEMGDVYLDEYCRSASEALDIFNHLNKAFI